MNPGAANKRITRPVDGILLLDKPLGVSSNTALQMVKRIYQAQKAGHTGSLDPLATGLLPICLGEATKLSGFLLDGDKRYRARARLGVKTSTGDSEGEVVAHSDPSNVDWSALEAVFPTFIGERLQVPPMFSALKHQGRRLYELARAGREVERSARAIRIYELKLLGFADGEFEIEVACSKGTYIRTLVEDIAAVVQQCAHVTALRRIAAEPFRQPAMVTLEQLDTCADAAERDALLLPPAAAVASLPQVRVDGDLAFYLGRGQAVQAGRLPEQGAIAVLDLTGRLLGIASRNQDGMLAPTRWLAARVLPC